MSVWSASGADDYSQVIVAPSLPLTPSHHHHSSQQCLTVYVQSLPLLQINGKQVTPVSRADALQELTSAQQPISVELVPKPTGSQQTTSDVTTDASSALVLSTASPRVTSTIATQTDDSLSACDVSDVTDCFGLFNFDLEAASALQKMLPFGHGTERVLLPCNSSHTLLFMSTVRCFSRLKRPLSASV